MVPRTILNQLSRLRWRERALRLAWSATLWLSLAALALTIACAIDWLIDRHQDTPLALRYGMLLAQAGLWIATAVSFGAWALYRRMGDDDLALHVEQRVPEYHDRLISALQLNRPKADTRGMSPELIAAVTRQAEERTAKLDFAAYADWRHWTRTVRLGVPLLVIILLVLALWSDTLAALVARQFLGNVDIPRSVALKSVTPEVWPSGEEVVLRFEVSGPGLRDGSAGTVRIIPNRLIDINTATADRLKKVPGLDAALAGRIVAERAKAPFKSLDELTRAGADRRTIDRMRQHLTTGEQPTEDYDLVRESKLANGAVYAARIPPGTVNFAYRAWVEDGRTRQPAQVRYEPRPAIVRQDAWSILPEYCGVRPSGKPYELYQPKADISGLPGSKARVKIETQKPVRQATLELLGAERVTDPTDLPAITADPLGGVGALLAQPFMWKDAPEAAQPRAREVVTRRVNMALQGDGQGAEVAFDLRPDESAYRIVVRDEHGFVNLDPPHRKVEIVPEPPPLVELLPERFAASSLGFTEEEDVSGIPVLFGSKVRIGYAARHPYSLGKAFLVYRINEGEWWRLPLAEVPADPDRGPFDLRRGLFQKCHPDDRVEFHAAPSPDPEALLGRTLGGGQLDFETARLPGIKAGDRLEYFVEVSSRNPGSADNPGRSDVRLKTVVPESEFLAWMRATLQQETRLRQLEKQQRGVFTTGVAGADDPPTTVKPIGPSKPPVLPERSNFVREWQLIGPFLDTNNDGHARHWPPQDDKIDLSKDYDNGKDKVGWRFFRSTSDKIDLERAFNYDGQAVGYAVCWVHAGERVSAQLSAGYCDGIKVYVNRSKVLDRTGSKAAAPAQHTSNFDLRDGWNEVLVKVHNLKGGDWAFFFELRDPQTGKPIPGVSYRATPPEDDDKRFVREWLLLGPFANPENGRDFVYPPEKEAVNTDEEYQGIDGKVRWRKYKSGANKIDLQKFFDRPFQERNLAYAVCWVRARERRPAVLATGSDDGIKVWLNRQLKIDQSGLREAVPGSDEAKLDLREGWNEIMVKVDNRFGYWAFYLELRDPETGRPLDNLELRTEPPRE